VRTRFARQRQQILGAGEHSVGHFTSDRPPGGALYGTKIHERSAGSD